MNINTNFPNRFYPVFTILLILLILLASFTVLSSPQGSSATPDKESIQKGNSLGSFDLTESGMAEDDIAKIFPTVWCADIDNVETQSSCWEAYRNGLEYYRFGLTHRENVLKWQHLSTKIILIVVLFLVTMGLYFAWVQFREGTAKQASTEIEISTSSIKVSSPVLGVIILTVSLAFFYLYLIYVYPIQEVI